MSDEMQEILNDFLTESNEMLEVLDQRFITLEADPGNKDLLNEIFRAMHSMKGSAGFLGFNRLVDVAHRGENILNKLRQGEMAVVPTVISVILEAIDVIKALMADIRESGTDLHVATDSIAAKLDAIINGQVGEPVSPEVASVPIQAQAPSSAPSTPVSAMGSTAAPSEPAPPTLGEILVHEGLASKDQVLDALNAQQHQPEPKTPLGEILLQAKAITERALDQALQKQEKQAKPAEEDATIRVETKRLDSVMNLVGELVLGRNRLIKIGTQLEQNHESDPQVRALSETLAQLNLVTTDLQLAVMKTRMLPIKKVFAKFLSFGDARHDAIMADNAEWLAPLNYIEFLRDVGRHFSVNRMLSFESVKSRLDREQSLSFLEFNYMILQAYDFLEIHRRYGCVLQMGGSDQWGNIVNGIDLTRRVLDHEIYGLTTPLLTTSDGRKMGKSAGGAVWLNGDMLSPYEFWQFWRNTTDADTGRFLLLYTDLEAGECRRLGALGGAEINEAKIVLANRVTALLHGEEAAAAAEATARQVFEAGGVGGELPTLVLAPAEVGNGISVSQLFVRSGLAPSGKEARRLIESGGARVDDEAITDPGRMFQAAMLARPVKLSAGRKRHALVTIG